MLLDHNKNLTYILSVCLVVYVLRKLQEMQYSQKVLCAFIQQGGQTHCMTAFQSGLVAVYFFRALPPNKNHEIFRFWFTKTTHQPPATLHGKPSHLLKTMPQFGKTFQKKSKWVLWAMRGKGQKKGKILGDFNTSEQA